MKSLATRVRRAYAPPQLSGRPLLENVVFPLYSSASLAAAVLPSELNLFQYALGQPVPGAGNWGNQTATRWHTNMETPSSLAAPKVFTITGIRVHVSPLVAAAANTPSLPAEDITTSLTAIDQINDNLRIFNSGVLRLTVGPKVYANHPLFFFPSNIGVGGLNDIGQDNGTASTLNARATVATHQVGQYWDFDQYPVVVAAQQSFGINISFTWATNPTLGFDRILTCFLDGILSREVS